MKNIYLYIIFFIIIIIILFPRMKEHFTSVTFYPGKKITNAKTVLYFTPIPIVLSPKHGNQTRILSTLNYFINNRYNIILVCNELYGWAPDTIKHLNNNGVSIYIIKNNTYIDIYEKEKPNIVFVNYIDMLSKNTINKMKNIILDLHDCPISNSQMYNIIRKKQITENTNFDRIKDLIKNIKKNMLDLSAYKINYLIHISYEEYTKYKKYTHINHVYIPYYEKPNLYTFNEFNSNELLIEHTDISRDYGEKNKVIFVASDNDFNIFAFKYFFKNTLPKIVSEIPDFKLYVYGIICDKIKHLKSPHIIYKGFVPNKSYIYNGAKFAICPLLFGTGAKIKVFEAISYNISIVSYEFSGTIELKHNINGLIAKNPNKFAEFIIKLYDNNDLVNKLSNSDHKLNYNILIDEMNNIMNKLTQ